MKNANINLTDDIRPNEETFIEVYKYALKKSKSKLLKTFLLGMTSGLFIGISYIASIYATRGMDDTTGVKNVLFGFVFIIAIVMIVFMGGEMFTSNSMMFLPVLKKQVKASTMLLNLLVVLIGNWIGCFILSLFTWWAGFLDNKQFLENAYQIVEHKLNMPWWKVFFSGVLCNFLVAGSVYISHSTRSSTARFFLITLIIFIFALTGFSHVVANSYLWGILPLFNIYEVKTTGMDFLKFGYQVQLPTLFGNFISGGLLLPGIYYLIFRNDINLPTMKDIEIISK